MGVYDEVFVPAGTGFGIFGLIYLFYFLFVGIIGVGSYVLQGISFYTIAKRRGIKHAWLSWIPVGSVWILGCISDQYQYVVKRQVKNKRKIMLGISIAVLVMSFLVLILCGVLIASAVGSDYGYTSDAELAGGVLVSVLGMTVASLVMSGLSIALVILQYFCLYDLYSSCDPSNNVTFLLLSIFLGFTMPILLFICRNKDRGMPPRKVAPAQIPVEPAAWQPTQPQNEPWENPENNE